MQTSIANWQNWLPILNGDLTDVFDERAASKVDKDTGNKIFMVEGHDEYNSSYQILPSTGGVRRIIEWEDMPAIASAQGFKKVYTTKQYGGSFYVTKPMWKYLSQKYPEIKKLCTSLVDDLFDKMDQSLADVLNNAWSTSYVDVYGDTVDATGADGLAFISASHRAGTGLPVFSNLIFSTTNNPALSRQAIVDARAAGNKFKDSAGMLRPIEFDTLLVGPDNWDLAVRLTQTDKVSGSNNNDTNETLTDLKPVKWNRITGAKWFLLDSQNARENTLICRVGQKPELVSPETMPASQSIVYTADDFYHIVLGDPRYVFGSNGSGS